VMVMADLVALSVQNYVLEYGVPAQAIRADQLQLDGMLHMRHQDAPTSLVLLDEAGAVLFQQGDVPSGAALQAWDGVSAALTRQTGAIFVADGQHEDVIAYAPVPNTRWVLLLREAWHSITAPLIQFEQVMPFILFTASGVSLLTLFFGVRYVVQPLRELSVRANRIGHSEFLALQQPLRGVQEIDDLRHALDGMAQRMQRYQAALHDYVGEVTRAQEEERGRLARELHDETVQTLIALGHKAQMAQRSLHRDSQQTEQRIVELREMIGEAIEEVRRFSQALHPHYLDELGLVSALEVLSRKSHAHFEVQGVPSRLPAEQELTLYRIAQEALNNALHHADAPSIQVRLRFEAHQICLFIHDDGRGFKVPAEFNDFTKIGHFGLMGMRERAQLVNGNLHIDSQAGRGTQVRLTLSPTSPP
jgi:signal transduction histidine kinase